MSGDYSKVINRIKELLHEENRLFLKAAGRFEKYGRDESVNEAGEHGHTTMILGQLLMEFEGERKEDTQ